MIPPRPKLPAFGREDTHTDSQVEPTSVYPGDTFAPLRLKVERYGNVLGLPARAFVFSNSERMTRGCHRKWLYSYGYRLRSQERARPLDYGSAWALVMEDLYLWFKHRPKLPYPWPRVLSQGCPWCSIGEAQTPSEGVNCVRCRDTGLSVLSAIQGAWREHAANVDNRYGPGEGDELRTDCEVLERALRGYLEVYGRLPTMEVLGVEFQLCVPVLRADGKPFASRIPLKREGQEYRTSYPGEVSDLWAVLPWYQVGRIDALLRDSNGSLWILDFKSSTSPKSYGEKVLVDPQTVGYAYMVQHALDRGLLPFKGKVLGMRFCVASSERQSIPEPLKQAELAQKDPLRDKGYTLKTPRLSMAAAQRTPSWLYREAVQSLAEQEGPWEPVNPGEYEAHIQGLVSRVDAALYVRQAVYASDLKLRQYAVELHGIAESIAKDLRLLPSLTDEDETYRNFPRIPLCTNNGQSCSFIPICSGGRLRDSYRSFAIGDGLRWEVL